MKKSVLALAMALALPVAAQKEASVTLKVNDAKEKINKEIYGQFAEHLGTCIYGGLWVGPESKIPNTQGYRNDVERLKTTASAPMSF